MARGQAKSNSKRNGRQAPILKDQGKPQGIKKQAIRKSARLQAIENLRKQFASKSNHIWEVQTPPLPLISNVPTGRKASQRPQVLHNRPEPSRKRKREQDAGHRSSQTRDQSPSKRLRTSPSSCIVEEKLHPGAASDTNENSPDPLQYWIQTGRWRKKYFEQDSQVREDFERGKSPEEFEQRDWLQEHYGREPLRPMHGFHPFQYLFARKKSLYSLCRKKSLSSLQTPSDQLPREVKSAQYRNPDYTLELENKGSYMREFDNDDIPKNVRDLCRTLLDTKQTVSQNLLFRDNLFKKTCRNIQDRNETIVIWDIGLLIVFSAQTLAIYGATHLIYLYETTNKGWMRRATTVHHPCESITYLS